MADRLIILYATCELTPAFNHVDTTYIKSRVTNALLYEGFDLTDLSVNYSASSLSFSSVFQITIKGNASNAYSDEAIRSRIEQVINSLTVATNYGVYITAPYPLFSGVSVKIVSNNVRDSRTEISESNRQGSQNAISNLGLDNFLTGAGLTTPIVVGALAVLLVLYLRK